MDLTFTRVPLPGAERGLAIAPTALDPLYACASANGFRTFGGSERSFLVAFEMPWSGPRRDEASVLLAVQDRWRGSGLQPHARVWWNQAFVYATAVVDAAGLRALESAAASGLVSRFEAGLVPSSAGTAPVLAMRAGVHSVRLPPCREVTLYGVIDSGCPLAHRRLRTRNGSTRVLQLWDQEGAFSIPGGGVPVDWGFGSAANAPDIESHFAGTEPADDWAAYRDAGLAGLAADASHGSHVLGCLFGAQANSTLLWHDVRDHVPVPQPDRRPEEPDLVFVQLPSAYLQGVSHSALGVYRLAGLRHILACAGPQTRQVVVPIASETYDGSHDGQSFYDAAVDAMVDFARRQQVGLFLLASAGNCLRTNTHQRVEIGPGSSAASMSLRVPPGNVRETCVELWMPRELDALEFTLQGPHATGLPVFHGGDGTWKVFDDAGRQVGTMASLRQATQAGGFQRAVVILLAATQGDGVTATPGDWKILLRAPVGVQPVPAGDVLAYIARSTPGPGGRRIGYQATFLRRFSQDWDFQGDCPAGPGRPFDAFSLSGLATTASVRAVGGYEVRTGGRAAYSAGGPARVPGRIEHFLLDGAAPSDASRNRAGILGWGNRSAGFMRLAGTSVAAPLAARAVATHGSLPVGAGKGRRDPQVAVADILP